MNIQTYESSMPVDVFGPAEHPTVYREKIDGYVESLLSGSEKQWVPEFHCEMYVVEVDEMVRVLGNQGVPPVATYDYIERDGFRRDVYFASAKARWDVNSRDEFPDTDRGFGGSVYALNDKAQYDTLAHFFGEFMALRCREYSMFGHNPTFLQGPAEHSNLRHENRVAHPLHRDVFNSLFNPLGISGMTLIGISTVCFDNTGYAIQVEHIRGMLDRFLSEHRYLREPYVGFIGKAIARFDGWATKSQHSKIDPVVDASRKMEGTVEHWLYGKCEILPVACNHMHFQALRREMGDYASFVKSLRIDEFSRVAVAVVAFPVSRFPGIAANILRQLGSTVFQVDLDCCSDGVRGFIEQEGIQSRSPAYQRQVPDYGYETVLAADGEMDERTAYTIAYDSFSKFIYQDLKYDQFFGGIFVRGLSRSGPPLGLNSLHYDGAVGDFDGRAFTFDVKSYMQFLQDSNIEGWTNFHFVNFEKKLREFLARCQFLKCVS
ncbi:hypothetical protein A2291_04650 [candidate division WOR-1 bacterium RIFOXYB2_FULL_42_35]|uniref:Uncharacterized protein n=1 Tax=candidate division WOR-1 bacterium RIFOXYC2_FULL_41_25 TaxID=1802586 RepID=A0A1F4TLE2_UNCSA|nr:MAG: hypothetical protein A2291_04650 [candidate division WOR-1 bacterium RIFOXYB2_FULL_42_35]OGC33532.1 MAG: hypothetical protein A2462_06975 [candidate division WOR-1 bacterium RIFOXYC2_FULL_41_25]